MTVDGHETNLHGVHVYQSALFCQLLFPFSIDLRYNICLLYEIIFVKLKELEFCQNFSLVKSVVSQRIINSDRRQIRSPISDNF